MNDYFPEVRDWTIPQPAIRESLAEMAIDGKLGNEGVVLWLGNVRNGSAILTHLVRLRGLGVAKKPDLLLIDDHLMNEVADVAIELDVQLIGQIHSHGPRHGVELSITDLRCGIAVPGYLSLVAPDYALRPRTSVADCGVHLCEANRQFRRLSVAEIADRIETNSSTTVPVLTVGGFRP